MHTPYLVMERFFPGYLSSAKKSRKRHQIILYGFEHRHYLTLSWPYSPVSLPTHLSLGCLGTAESNLALQNIQAHLRMVLSYFLHCCYLQSADETQRTLRIYIQVDYWCWAVWMSLFVDSPWSAEDAYQCLNSDQICISPSAPPSMFWQLSNNA